MWVDNSFADWIKDLLHRMKIMPATVKVVKETSKYIRDHMEWFFMLFFLLVILPNCLQAFVFYLYISVALNLGQWGFLVLWLMDHSDLWLFKVLRILYYDWLGLGGPTILIQPQVFGNIMEQGEEKKWISHGQGSLLWNVLSGWHITFPPIKSQQI